MTKKKMFVQVGTEDYQAILLFKNADRHKSSAHEDDEPPAKRKKTKGTSRATKEDCFEEVSTRTPNWEETKAHVFEYFLEISVIYGWYV